MNFHECNKLTTLLRKKLKYKQNLKTRIFLQQLPKMLMPNAKIGKVGKVLICGMKGVGKTALLEQLIYGNITTETVREIWVKSSA